MTHPSLAAAAKKLGISVAEYEKRRAAGWRWCSEGKHWVKADEIPHYTRGICREHSQTKAARRKRQRAADGQDAAG